jgi:putative membrane protein
MSTLFAFLHHLCAFTLVAAVAVEFVLIRAELTLWSARRLQVTDLVLGVAAGALFVVGLLSIIPTREFLSWGGALKAGQVPAIDASKRKLVTAVIHGELLAIVIILLCAAIMARGGWV